MAAGYLPVDTPPGAAPLPMGTPVPAGVGAGKPAGGPPPPTKRASTRPPLRKPRKGRKVAKRPAFKGNR